MTTHQAQQQGYMHITEEKEVWAVLEYLRSSAFGVVNDIVGLYVKETNTGHYAGVYGYNGEKLIKIK